MAEAARVVLPGVGAFANAMDVLHNRGLVCAIQEVARRRTPLLGICLGMQLLLDESEEFGRTPGLGLISGSVVPVPTRSTDGQIQKIPHIGWYKLQRDEKYQNWNGTLLEDNLPGEAVYFVHSFMAMPINPVNRLADCNYGGHLVSAAIISDRITGCQFHPEKSGEVGLKILRKFCAD